MTEYYKSLEDALNITGHAQNSSLAWGYAPISEVKKQGEQFILRISYQTLAPANETERDRLEEEEGVSTEIIGSYMVVHISKLFESCETLEKYLGGELSGPFPGIGEWTISYNF